jgi:CRISPR-associated protein Cmr1
MKDQEFVFHFMPLRPIRDEEWALLDLTLRIIADYGAIGGRTVFKPSDEQRRENMLQHRDYGLIEIISRPTIKIEEKQLCSYLKQSHWRNADHGDYAWASMTNLWSVKGRHLSRQNFASSTFNKVLGRKEEKNKGQRLEVYNEVNKWLAGRQQESKKVLSFKQSKRTFGFVKPGVIDFIEMKKRLKVVWPDLNDNEFCLVSDKINNFIKSSGGAP